MHGAAARGVYTVLFVGGVRCVEGGGAERRGRGGAERRVERGGERGGAERLVYRHLRGHEKGGGEYGVVGRQGNAGAE